MMMKLLFLIALFGCVVNSIRINNDNGLSFQSNCLGGSIQIAESIPLALNLQSNLSTHDAWMELITNAKKSIDMGIFYMTLTDGGQLDPVYGGQLGLDIYKALVDANSRGVSIRIVQNQPSSSMPDTDTQNLAKLGVQVRSINWPSLVGAGILHTKVIVVDQVSAYLGSANLDWRSLAQVKELGVLFQNCPSMVSDTEIAFQQYWDAAVVTELPSDWGVQYQAAYNQTNMASLLLNGNEKFEMFLAVSPPQFVSTDRTGDIDALVSAMNGATKTICISVMDYIPASLYNSPNTFWPVMDNALRAAAYNRGVQVRMLISHWNHTNYAIPQWLHSLDQVNNIDVRWFVVPDFPNEPQVPFTRVNHAKYMVTDEQSYVGTSNWSEDYYTNTGGLSYNIYNDEFTSQLQSIFDRDWNSPYSFPVTTY
ncbi:phospholipase D3 [Dictyostelium discoideum AX4]|uniref:Phospholipase D Z n=1 Tax=Dictyostelium discoideum TaxID=44689 RepID=PLDZ_DICDI|nr:phospholipase D3 [Dictyostelium discoideum AX4]Q54SA1.1 RecName: Full=Phospholipase D Z; AltName: Full=Phosphatase D3; Short=PLD 3; Flags: Precursor [Dictyostelium discoideum]EAL66149.1 phospholipase D3 [Dictyostelium discoideum AX4]|eukprot:XP_640138.1 phospholipase D3 [Dictyostelium discoideum AX4]